MSMQAFKINKLEKKVKKLEDQLLAKSLEHDLEMTKLNRNWSTKISIVVGIFEEALNTAGTIGEAKRWFAEWSSDINSDMTPADLIEKHGFKFELKEVETDYREEIKRGR